MSLKSYCEQNGLDMSEVFDMVLGEGGGLLPQRTAFQGYYARITDTALVCTNDKLGVVNCEIPFDAFTSAEFGIGSGQLWLQCTVNGRPFVFCTNRKGWKSAAAKRLLERIGAVTELQGTKDYDRYTGKLFFLYIFK